MLNLKNFFYKFEQICKNIVYISDVLKRRSGMPRYLIILVLFLAGLSVSAQTNFSDNTSYPVRTGVNFHCRQYTEGDIDYLMVPWVQKSNALAYGPRAVPNADPYIIEVDGTKYMMIKDNKDGRWDESDILGINDPKENLFLSLVYLNTDSDGSKLSAKELANGGVRFVAVGADGKLALNDKSKDFDLKKIDYIDLANLKQLANSEDTGLFGHFNVYLKTSNGSKRLVIGQVTFDRKAELKSLF